MTTGRINQVTILDRWRQPRALSALGPPTEPAEASRVVYLGGRPPCFEDHGLRLWGELPNRIGKASRQTSSFPLSVPYRWVRQTAAAQLHCRVSHAIRKRRIPTPQITAMKAGYWEGLTPKCLLRAVHIVQPSTDSIRARPAEADGSSDVVPDSQPAEM